MLCVKSLMVERNEFNLTVENFSIKSDSINLILGPNGGGKTTFLKSLAGLLNYDGMVSLDDVELNYLNFKERAKVFGYLSQGAYIGEILAKDFLILGRFPYTGMISRYTKADWNKVYETAELFDIGEYLKRDMSTLSQGELQRVLLAKVFIQEPRILLLDEPTTALDIGFKELVKKQIYKYLEIKPRSIVLISTHEPDVFIDNTKTVLMLKQGRVFDFGEKQRVYNNETVKKLFNLF